MLEGIQAVAYEASVFRFANHARYVEVLRDMGLAADDIAEVIALLRDRGLTQSEAEVLDGPFSFKPALKREQTRFSDGTVRVFYSALEAETAEREATHWHLKSLLQGEQPVRLFFRSFRCQFAGDMKDLRPLVDEWPFLVADNGYSACNPIGAEAAASGLGCLLSQSARHPGGTTSPVFRRNCLSAVEFQGWKVFSYAPGQDVTVSSV